MASDERRSGIRIALGLALATFAVSAILIHSHYADMRADALSDALGIPRGSLLLACAPAAAVLYFSLIDVLLPLGRGHIASVTALVSKIRS